MVFAKNAEECANSMQFYIEEYVEKTGDAQAMARKAYLSFLRSYSCYASELKSIFHLKNLHIGHVAKSFGLREAPKQISGHHDLFKGSQEARFSSSSQSGNRRRNNNETDDNGEYDPLKTKYARDLKRLSNGHREYGNVVKKNKLKSQKADMDLSGLLRRSKTVSEYSSGIGGQTINEKRPATGVKRPLPSSSATSNHGETRRERDPSVKKPPIKIFKKNLDIFD